MRISLFLYFLRNDSLNVFIQDRLVEIVLHLKMLIKKQNESIQKWEDVARIISFSALEKCLVDISHMRSFEGEFEVEDTFIRKNIYFDDFLEI